MYRNIVTGELQHAVSHSGSKLLITVPALVNVAKEAAKTCPDLKVCIATCISVGCWLCSLHKHLQTRLSNICRINSLVS